MEWLGGDPSGKEEQVLILTTLILDLSVIHLKELLED
jgi:hypothetical protein